MKIFLCFIVLFTSNVLYAQHSTSTRNDSLDRIPTYGIDLASSNRNANHSGLSLGLMYSGTVRNGICLGFGNGTDKVNGLDINALASGVDTLNGIAITGFWFGGAGSSCGPDQHLVNGIVISGLVAGTRECNGIIIAPFTGTRKTRGIQIGLFNGTQELHGIQIGLLNRAENGFLKWFPGFNIGI